ncbi:MAG TPA: hypothetical protein VHC69_09645 [Polyangiaceae bacterium]|nr:hypothetical protein [Polyangiaceae bacterium]
MSDGQSQKKPSPPAPLAPQVMRSFPPVPRPAESAAAGSIEALVLDLETEGAAAPEKAAETPPTAVDEPAPVSSKQQQAPLEARPPEEEEDEPPSLEALVVPPRPTQVSEPLALEALGRAARLIVNPISTAPAPSVSIEYDSSPTQPQRAATSSEVRPVAEEASPAASEVPTPRSASAPDEAPLASPPEAPVENAPAAPARDVPAAFDEPPATTPSIPSPESTAAPVLPAVGAGAEDHSAPESAAVVTRLVASLMITTSLVMVIWHMQLTSRENANTGSRYATIESLVDYGTYNIDASRYLFTPDKVKARGHFVSSKPPLLPTYGAGVYWLLKRVTGYNITENESIVVWTVGVFTGWLSHLVFLLYFYRLCKVLLKKQLAILVSVAAACFAYLGVAYATAINNHSVGAALAVAGFYHAFKAKHELGGKLEWVFAGVTLGILPAIDLSSLALTGLTGIYLLTKNWKRTLLLYAPAALPGLVAQPLLAHAATGSWIPAYADASLMAYKGSYFGGHRAGIDALFEPKPVYAFNVLIGHHGVFSMTPIFIFGLVEIVRRLWKRDKFVPETIVFSVCFTVVTAFYIFRTHNYGGWCVGMRWLVPVMPWLLVMFGLWVDRAKIGRIKWTLVVLAFAVSAFNVQDGLTSPFQFSVWHNWLEDAPNRNRIGPTWVLSRPSAADKKQKSHGRPKR